MINPRRLAYRAIALHLPALKRRVCFDTQPQQDISVEGVRLERFADEVVHPGFFTGDTILVKGIGRHRQNRDVRLAGQGANHPGGFEAVHLRHLDVHQHQVIALVTHLFHGLQTIPGHIGIQIDRQQEVQRNFAVDLLIIHQQDARTTVFLAQLLLRIGSCIATRLRSMGPPMLQTGSEPEGAPFSGLTADPHFAAHQARQSPGDRQSKTGSAIFPGRRNIALFESLKDPGDFFRRNADAGIGNLKMD